MLACWSFGLFGLSQFLRVFRSVFLPQPFFIGCGRVLFATLQSHHRAFSIPSKSRHSLHSVALHFVYSGTCPARKKTTLHGKNSASPAVNGCRQRRFTSLHATCLQRPLSTRGRLAPLPQSAVQKLRYASHFVQLLSVGSRLLYLLCFPLLPRTAPDHPPPPKKKDS